MKKNILAAILIAMGSVNAMAQNTTKTDEVVQRVDTVKVHYFNKYHSKFKDNWSVELLGSARVLFGEEDGNLSFGKRICPAIQLGVTKDLDPDISLRGTFSIGSLKGWDTGSAGLYKWQADWKSTDPVRQYLESQGKDCSNGYQQDIRYFTVGVDMMLNLWNIWTSNNQLNRRWTPYLIGGVEYYRMLKHNGCYATYKVGAHLGLKCDLKLSERVALTGEVGTSIHSATMDNVIGKGHRFDAFGAASLGVKFRLGNQGYRVDKVLPTGEYVRLGNVVTGINEQYKTAAQTAVIGNLFAPSVVFDDNQDTYSEELQMVNMFRMSEYMKDNPNLKVSVIGNTHSVSQDLAERRANIVRQKMIDRYGIDPSRLVATTMDVNREYDVKGNDQAVNFGVAQ